jgi:hypothetical protein
MKEIVPQARPAHRAPHARVPLPHTSRSGSNAKLTLNRNRRRTTTHTRPHLPPCYAGLPSTPLDPSPRPVPNSPSAPPQPHFRTFSFGRCCGPLRLAGRCCCLGSACGSRCCSAAMRRPKPGSPTTQSRALQEPLREGSRGMLPSPWFPSESPPPPPSCIAGMGMRKPCGIMRPRWANQR